MSPRPDQAGATLIIAIVVIVVFAVLGLSLLSMHTTQRVSAADHFASARALYLAESGLEWAARELFAAADPQADCEALTGVAPVTLGAGTFHIAQATYDAVGARCLIVSIGAVGDTRRRVTGAVRRAVLDGTSGTGPDTVFDDSGAWTGGGANVNFDARAIIFSRPGGLKGKALQPTQIEGDNVLTDTFVSGEAVYFTADFSANGTLTGTLFTIEVVHVDPLQSVTCTVALGTLISLCGVTGTELNEHFQVVLFIGNTINAADIDKIRIRVDWGALSTASQLRVDNACLGRIEHCTPDSGGDPVDPDSWEEVRLPRDDAGATIVVAPP